eukprot:scaffold69979_cov69-Phaeocystis_antarctica.AAC.2
MPGESGVSSVRGLCGAQSVSVSVGVSAGVLVLPDRARRAAQPEPRKPPASRTRREFPRIFILKCARTWCLPLL